MNLSLSFFLRVCAALFWLLPVLAAQAATFTVTNLADGGAGSLRAAIDSANGAAGADVIDFAPGLTGSVMLASELPGLAGGITLQGPGAGLLTVEPDQSGDPHRIFSVPPGATASLAGITMRRGSTAYRLGHGGGIVNFGSLTVTNCVLEQNVVSEHYVTELKEKSRGGGIFNAVGANLVVDGCTFRENAALLDDGGAICNEGTATVRNSTFSNNTRGSSFPGLLHAIWNKAGAMTLDGVTVTLNAGGLRNGATATLRNSIVAGNSVVNLTLETALASASANNFTSGNPLLGPLQDNGGPTRTHRPLATSPVRNAGVTTLTIDQRGVARPFENAPEIGAVEFTPKESLVVTTLTDEDNGNSDVDFGTGTSLREALAYAKILGGSPVITFAPSVTGVIQLTGSLPNMNYSVAIQGPGAGVLTVRRAGDTNSPFRVMTGATVSVSGLTLANNGPGTGTVFVNLTGSTLTLTNCVFSGQVSLARGAAIFNSGLLCTVTDCTFTGNTAALEGGAIYSTSALNVNRCTFSGNAAQTGGAIFSGGGTAVATLRASTFNGNSATLDGGAVGMNGGAMNMENCTLSANSAQRDGGGFSSVGNAITLDSVTAVLNRADSDGNGTGTGGGWKTGSASERLRNSIVAQNLRGTGTVSDDIAGTLLENTNNFLGGNPQLEPLAQAGGPTATHRPILGSPVINTGLTALNVDQRGFARPLGGADDIGAHEFSDPIGPASLVVSVGTDTISQDGFISLREAITNANAQGGTPAISFGGYTGTIELTSTLPSLSANMAITGPGANLLTVRRSNALHIRIFHVAPGVHAQISGLTIANGSSTQGAGLLNEGTATVTACAFNANIGADTGGGIHNMGTLIVENCALRANTSRIDGGGIYSTGPLTIRNSTLSANTARRDGGGVMQVGSVAALDSVTITGNRADADNNNTGLGAGIFHAAAVTLQSSVVTENTRGTAAVASDFEGPAPAGTHSLIGGTPQLGPYQDNGGPTFTHAPLVGSPLLGGGKTTLTQDQRGLARPQVGVEDIGAVELIFTPQNESLIVTTLIDEDNGTSDPAYGIGVSLREAIRFANSRGVASAITFAPGLTGTILLQSPLLAMSGVQSITAPSARAIRVERSTGGSYRIFAVASGATVSLHGLVIANGLVEGNGGGIVNNGTLSIADCQITGNEASGVGVEGGGIYNSGTLTVEDSEISSNRAQSFGGGVCSRAGAVILRRCTISQNRTNWVGGAIYSRDGSLTLQNCTLSTNEAVVAGGGLTVATQGTMAVVVEHCTITANVSPAGGGGGLYTFAPGGSMCQVSHTIVAGNSGGDVRTDSASVQSNGWNLVGPGPGVATFNQTGDQSGLSGAALFLTPLANHGSPRLTHALNFRSPAGNAGNPAIMPASPALDGRGFPRIAEGRIDIGAVEYILPQANESLVVTTLADENNGTSDPAFGTGTSLREAMLFAEALPDASAITFAPGLAGEIPLASALPILTTEVSITAATSAPGFPHVIIVGRSTGGDYRIFEVAGGAVVSLSGLEISNGKTSAAMASPDGAGILNAGTLTVTHSLVYGNQASAPGGTGGGISNSGTLTVRDSAFEFNGATGLCGGLQSSAGTVLVERALIRGSAGAGVAASGGAVLLRNCTISQNIGAINVSSAGTATIEHSTIADNGGAGISANGTGTDAVRVNHCIVIRNNGADVVTTGAAVKSDGWNLVGVGNGIAGFTQPGDRAGLVSADVRLNTLGGNGGPFLSCLPRLNSPARNGGNPALQPPVAPLLDGRGFPRVLDGVIDIGALETPNTPPTAGADSIARYPERSISVLEATLLANDFDVNNDAFALTATGPAASGQATVTRANGYVFYDPAPGFTGPDTFTYTITDALGGSSIGTVSVTILTGAPPSEATIIALEPAPGGGATQARLAFTGVPGRTYRVQFTDDLGTQPIVWETAVSATADAQGRLEIIDPPPLPPRRFYRAVFP